eukprot:Colp12_sorted_trinity150504_noHs@18524
MAQISLKINITKTNTVKTMQFDGDMSTFECLKLIRERLGEPDAGDHGLFFPEENSKKGKWLEPSRTLNFYDIQSGDLLEYKKKHRALRVEMMDETVKTVMIDESMRVGKLVEEICSKIGISNPEEFSLKQKFITEEDIKDDKKSTKDSREAKLQKQMQDLKKKNHTDDDAGWLKHDLTLREQGVDETAMLILRKKFYFSDANVDRNDPVQLNLLYVQARNAILDGTHQCTPDESWQFAAMQMQIQFGDHDPDKHKPGCIDLKQFLPLEYAESKNVKQYEKNIYRDHATFKGMSALNMKYRYIQLCRSLKTYGMTFFMVKEKLVGKNKLVPRLMGITRDKIMRLDENTKEVLKEWPITRVKKWTSTPNSL